jgi:hypothetical protein
MKVERDCHVLAYHGHILTYTYTYIHEQDKLGREGPGPSYDVRMTYKGISLIKGTEHVYMNIYSHTLE